MEVKIDSFQQVNETQSVVQFTSAYGVCDGIWEGKMPMIGSKNEVELDIDDKLDWNTNVYESSERQFILQSIEKNIRIIAEFESVADNDNCILRIENSFLMVDIQNLPQIKKGTFLEIRPKVIKLFDINL